MLPFIQPPAAQATRKIGNSRCGILEVAVRGGLTVNESATIKSLLVNQTSAFIEAAKVADVIAKAESITLTEAFQIVEDAASNRPAEPDIQTIRIKHAERLAKVVQIFQASGQRTLEATVTALVRSRCNLPDWSLEDTQAMDQALFDGFVELANDEQAAEDLPSTPPTEEELGKPQPVKMTGRKRTGNQSSGI